MNKILPHEFYLEQLEDLISISKAYTHTEELRNRNIILDRVKTSVHDEVYSLLLGLKETYLQDITLDYHFVSKNPGSEKTIFIVCKHINSIRDIVDPIYPNLVVDLIEEIF